MLDFDTPAMLVPGQDVRILWDGDHYGTATYSGVNVDGLHVFNPFSYRRNRLQFTDAELVQALISGEVVR